MNAVRGEAIATEHHDQGGVIELTFVPENTSEVVVAHHVLVKMVEEINDFRRLKHALRVVR